MKRKHIAVTAVVIAAVLMTTAFALAGSEEKIVEDLINERTTTLRKDKRD